MVYFLPFQVNSFLPAFLAAAKALSKAWAIVPSFLGPTFLAPTFLRLRMVPSLSLVLYLPTLVFAALALAAASFCFALLIGLRRAPVANEVAKPANSVCLRPLPLRLPPPRGVNLVGLTAFLALNFVPGVGGGFVDVLVEP